MYIYTIKLKSGLSYKVESNLVSGNFIEQMYCKPNVVSSFKVHDSKLGIIVHTNEISVIEF